MRDVRNWKLILGQFDNRYVRLSLFVVTLLLFVLGAGAPAIDGGH